MSKSTDPAPQVVTRPTARLLRFHFFLLGLNVALVVWILILLIGLVPTIEQNGEAWKEQNERLDSLIKQLNIIEEQKSWTPLN